MPKIEGVVNLTGLIAPTATEDTYAVTDAIYGRDGLRNVESNQARNAIPPGRRRLGMVVGVAVAGETANYYYLATDSGGASTSDSDWLAFGSGGSIIFSDEGTTIGTYSKVNFVGSDVSAMENPTDSTMLNVYIPSPAYASHFNTNDGTGGTGAVVETLPRYNVRISEPTSEGNPFKTGGWAGTTQSATSTGTVSFATSNAVTGQGGNANVAVTVFDADGTTSLATYTTPAITGNATHTSAGQNAGITVQISGYAQDSLKYKAVITVTVNMITVFATNSLSGGKYRVQIVNTTDSATDGGQPFTYTQSFVFLDINPNTPAFGAGTTTIGETATSANVITKHLSGVEYYTIGSKFDVGVSSINNLNANTQGRALSDSTNFHISAPSFGISTLQLRSWSPTSGTFTGRTEKWNNQGVSYAVSDLTVSTASYRYRGASASATASLFDPWNSGGSQASAGQAILVDTYATSGSSTTLIETFNDEEFRKASDYTTAWTSTATLSNSVGGSGIGEACVVGGTLVRADRFFLTDPNTSTIQANLASYKPDKGGANPNYSTYSNDASYYRLFYRNLDAGDPAIANFTMTFVGTFAGGNALADLTSSALKVFIRKINAYVGASGVSSDPLNLHGAQYDSGTFNDGVNNSQAGYAQVRLGSSSGNTIQGTFGGYSAKNGVYVEIRICSPTIRIDTITVAFT